jgi:hypothetical protein
MRSPNPDRTHQRSTASGRTNAAPPPMSMCDIFMSEKRFIMAFPSEERCREKRDKVPGNRQVLIKSPVKKI